MKERWKFISNTSNEYIVSNLGNVMSLPKIDKNGRGNYVDSGAKLKPIVNNHGYLYVRIRVDGKMKKEYIHRLVAKEFIKNPKNKPFVNHKDCNPKNNVVENLEWCTPQENVDYMISLKRNKRTKEWIDNLHKSKEKIKKPVIGIEIQTGKILEFNSIQEAGRNGFHVSDVYRCCNGLRKQCKGYQWHYMEDMINGFTK